MKKKNHCNHLYVSRQFFVLTFNYMSFLERGSSEIFGIFDFLKLSVNVHRGRPLCEHLIICLRKSTSEIGVEILGIFHFH